jgi:ABC-type polysaccharide/polyol phosphate transport system ATPase subunit
MPKTLIKVENVSKKFCRSLKRSLWYGLKDLSSELIGISSSNNDELRPDEFWAVKDVSFELKQGDCLGLIGRNGAGKTTLLRLLNGLIKPDRGRIEIQGRMRALIALGAGFNPVLTGRENIYVNASILGLSNKEIDAKFDEIVDFAEVEDFIDTPVQNYSSGMAVRLGFAIASSLNPDILILDEVLAVGDSAFQLKCYNRIGVLMEAGTATIIVSHQLNNLERLAKFGAVINQGSLCFEGTVLKAIEYYQEINYKSSDSFQVVYTEKTKIHILKITDETCERSGKLKISVHYELQRDKRINCHVSYVLRTNGIEVLRSNTLKDEAESFVLEQKGALNIIIDESILWLPKLKLNFSIWSHDFSKIFVWIKDFEFKANSPCNPKIIFK